VITHHLPGARPSVGWFLRFLALTAVLGLCAPGAGCGARTAPAPGESSSPRRILSHTLATDEILLELVPTDRIVGVTSLVDDPEISNVAGRYPPDIPRLKEANAERIFGLTPDLVCVAPYNSIDFINLLERSGLAVYRNDAVNSIDEIQTGIEQLGKRVAEPEKGRQLAAQMRARRAQLAERLRGVRERPRVLFWSAGYTAGPRSTIDDLIREAGGNNVAAELGMGASAEISPEQMVAADPDYLLLCGWAGDDRPNRVDNHPVLRNLRAVRMNRVLIVEGRYVTSISHYVVDGVERVARLLHPECAREPAP
jgi:iron complex transport system substrate-binding protein